MSPYEVILQSQAWNTLAELKGEQRRRLLVIFDRIAANPGQKGDFQQLDQTGRSNEVLLIDEWLVTFWSDNAVREIRVVALERADEGS